MEKLDISLQTEKRKNFTVLKSVNSAHVENLKFVKGKLADYSRKQKILVVKNKDRKSQK